MKLLTHNMLACPIKGVKQGFPFAIEPRVERTEVDGEVREQQHWEVSTQDVDFDPEFLRHIFPRIDWPALRTAAASLGYTDLPEMVPEGALEDDDFLQAFHHALLELHLEEGQLTCPETGRPFPVRKGIPNLLLHEDEC